jgi:hypothetical protein
MSLAFSRIEALAPDQGVAGGSAEVVEAVLLSALQRALAIVTISPTTSASSRFLSCSGR